MAKLQGKAKEAFLERMRKARTTKLKSSVDLGQVKPSKLAAALRKHPRAMPASETQSYSPHFKNYAPDRHVTAHEVLHGTRRK